MWLLTGSRMRESPVFVAGFVAPAGETMGLLIARNA
jgi:hypothetical protein